VILLGFSMEQWAEMAGYFALLSGYLPLPNLASAILILHHWESRRSDNPTGATIILGVKKEMEFQYVTRLFLKVRQETFLV